MIISTVKKEIIYTYLMLFIADKCKLGNCLNVRYGKIDVLVVCYLCVCVCVGGFGPQNMFVGIVTAENSVRASSLDNNHYKPLIPIRLVYVVTF